MIITFCKQWKSRISALRAFLHPPVTSSLSDLNIFHSILSTNILSIFLPQCVRLQVSNNHTKQQAILQFCKNLTFRFSHTKQESKRFWPEWYQTLCELNILLISSCMLCLLCLKMLHVIKSVKLYAFFCVSPQRLNFICRCFGTLCVFYLHRRIPIRLSLSVLSK
jgi:hypothetical protein